MSFPAAILAGGLGTRLGELTRSIPKALIPIDGQPFLAHQLALLRRNGIDRVVMCLGHYGEQIREFAGDGSQFGLSVDYSFDGPTLLGTAGALRRASHLLDDAFFVIYGDSYLPCHYQAVRESFELSGKRGLMTVFHNRNAFDTSNVEFRNGAIAVYDKKNRTPAMHHIDYGLGVFRRDVFLAIPENQPYDLAQVYVDLLVKGDLAAYEVAERFYEIGSVQGIRELEQYLRGEDKR